ncbi:hypothetical protein ACJMK2_024731 [Sinanodonta woodiana]|uniref:Uncharacterized protein n=1 Tax=Sinanodonta woodiana TaxID=1069815 RepID=A0ABD3XEA6_SINWO
MYHQELYWENRLQLNTTRCIIRNYIGNIDFSLIQDVSSGTVLGISTSTEHDKMYDQELYWEYRLQLNTRCIVRNCIGNIDLNLIRQDVSLGTWEYRLQPNTR